MIIARTRSGYPVRYGMGESALKYGEGILLLPFPDQFDFFCVAQWSLARSRHREGSQSEAYIWWTSVVRLLERRLDLELTKKEMNGLKLTTSIQMLHRGKSLSLGSWQSA